VQITVALVALALAAPLATSCSGGSASPSSGPSQSVQASQSSGGKAPGGILGVVSEAGIEAACADVQTADTDQVAGDDASASAALTAAVAALRKPPIDPSAQPIATSIAAKLSAGDTGSALAVGQQFCRSRGR